MIVCRRYNSIDTFLFDAFGYVYLKLDLIDQDLVDLLASILFKAVHRYRKTLAGQNSNQVFQDKLEDFGKVVEEEHEAIDRDGMLMSALEHLIKLSESTESACRGVNSLQSHIFFLTDFERYQIVALSFKLLLSDLNGTLDRCRAWQKGHLIKVADSELFLPGDNILVSLIVERQRGQATIYHE